MIRISQADAKLLVHAAPGELAPRHESQLNFWGFASDPVRNAFSCPIVDAPSLAPRLVAYFGRAGLKYELTPEVDELMAAHSRVVGRLSEAAHRGRKFKNADLHGLSLQPFIQFSKSGLARPLKPHQLKAALHLLCVENGANFSVPGSGKTSVILAVFEWLRKQGLVDALFVVGPPSCFGPWRHEYREVLGRAPQCQMVAGGDVDVRRSRYQVNQDSAPELYLTTFQTLQRDHELVRVLFEQQNIRFFFVVDEAHYIKQIGGAWASAALAVAKGAVRRCVLTGTPFPRSYADGFNLFDLLWPDSNALTNEDRQRVIVSCQNRRWHQAAEILDGSIGPLFYRVRKDDLGLAPQVFHPPIRVPMRANERLVYDLVIDRIQTLSLSDSVRNHEALMRLRRGRMMRLRQTISYTPLLQTALNDYEEELVTDELSVARIIRQYESLERPAKMDALLELVKGLTSAGEKVLVWSNFVRTLESIQSLFNDNGIGVRLIYGTTPIERSDLVEELTREEIIAEFLDRDSGVQVLVANPAACAESISLHRSCSHAVYYDLSYNCAQYVQSLDRIHRVGGSEHRASHYYFLEYEDTIDKDILANVRRKAENMSRVIDNEYPVYSLDMFNEDEELEAYEQLFGPGRKRV